MWRLHGSSIKIIRKFYVILYCYLKWFEYDNVALKSLKIETFQWVEYIELLQPSFLSLVLSIEILLKWNIQLACHMVVAIAFTVISLKNSNNYYMQNIKWIIWVSELFCVFSNSTYYFRQSYQCDNSFAQKFVHLFKINIVSTIVFDSY